MNKKVYADEPVYLTKQGLDQLKKEYEELTKFKRAEIAEAIKQAKEFGDLSENAEYESAKNQQALIEGRIATLEKMIANAQIISDNAHSSIIIVGSTVTVVDDRKKKKTYSIVGSAESDPLKGRISNESPMGEALLGHKAGDIVTVPTPGGVRELEILEIS